MQDRRALIDFRQKPGQGRPQGVDFLFEGPDSRISADQVPRGPEFLDTQGRVVGTFSSEVAARTLQRVTGATKPSGIPCSDTAA